MSNFKRLNGYYVARKKKDVISISHEPRWRFYFANKEKFFRKRGDAYRKLADLLDQKFWAMATRVESTSVVVDFAREGAMEEKLESRFFDRSGFTMIWFMNLYNWRFSRVIKFLTHFGSNRVSYLNLDRETFVCVYREGDCT